MRRRGRGVRGRYSFTMSTRARIGIIGLAVTAVIVVLITLTAADSGSFHGPLARVLRGVVNRLIPGAEVTKAQFGFAANIVMFVPLGFFLGLALPRGKFLNGIVALPMASAIIESIQYFLPTRGTQFEDILANSVGSWIGLGVAWVMVVLMDRRERENACSSAGVRGQSN